MTTAHIAHEPAIPTGHQFLLESIGVEEHPMTYRYRSQAQATHYVRTSEQRRYEQTVEPIRAESR